MLFCNGQRGRSAQRPFCQVNKPKKKAARSAREPIARRKPTHHTKIFSEGGNHFKCFLRKTFKNLKKTALVKFVMHRIRVFQVAGQ